MTKALRALLLEDSAADAELISDELDRAGMQVVVQRVASKEAFARALREFRPDVILSDHGLTQFNTRAAMRIVQQLRPTAPVIVVTGSLEDQSAVACLRVGAETIVLKSNLRGLRSAIDSAIARRRPLELLSPRQLEVLRLVAEGNTTREIATRLHVSVKTVETHRGAIIKRLGIHDVAGLVRYALRVGLVSLDP
jgi:DNA-binding NarL/FixJ family response regulator